MSIPRVDPQTGYNDFDPRDEPEPEIEDELLCDPGYEVPEYWAGMNVSDVAPMPAARENEFLRRHAGLNRKGEAA